MTFDFLSGSAGTIDAVLRSRAIDLPAKHAVESADASLTYRGLDELVDRFASALRSAGARRGTAAAVFMQNRPEYLWAMFGIIRSGAVYVPCSTQYTPDELHYQLDHVEARWIVVDSTTFSTFAKVRDRCTSIETVYFLGPDPPAGTFGLEPIASTAVDRVPVDHGPNDPAMIMYTSGSTDRPKGIEFSHGNLVGIAESIVDAFDWCPDDRVLHFFPMPHINGGVACLLPSLYAGATLVMIPKFSASRFSQQLCEHDITYTHVNSTHVKMILNNPPTPFDARHRTRRMYLGLTLDAGTTEEFERRFETRLCGSYGFSEACGIVTAARPRDPRTPGSSGRVLRGYEVKVVDEGGAELPPGESGEILIGHHLPHGMSRGYFKDPTRTAQVFRDGWLYSGDIGYFDGDGYLWFTARTKDVIKRSGYSVAPAEIERVISNIDGIADVAVVGTPDAMREEAIVAFVVAADRDVDERTVIDACSEELAEYKVPQRVRFLEQLPYSVLGKVDRKVLRAWALEYQVTSTERAPSSSAALPRTDEVGPS